MPTDPHGHTHVGSHGLFDDADELAAGSARAETHQYARASAQIARLRRRDARKAYKEEKALARATHSTSTSTSAFQSSFFGKLFGGRKDLGPDATPARKVGREEVEYVIERRLPTPEPVYAAEDVDPVGSLWLSECGMVKIRSADPGGCHIVPKSVIEKSE